MRTLLVKMPVVLLAWFAASMGSSAVSKDKIVGTWADVQTIKAGREVEAMLLDSSRFRGKLVKASEDGIVIRVDGVDRDMLRVNLRSVAVRERKTAKGLAIGLLIGVGMGIPAAMLQGGGAFAGSLVWAGAGGAAIGSLNKGYRVVYRVDASGRQGPCPLCLRAGRGGVRKVAGCRRVIWSGPVVNGSWGPGVPGAYWLLP